MKAFIYTNDTAEILLFEGTTSGISGGQLVVTTTKPISGLTKNAKYKYSLEYPNVNVETATLTNIASTTYTFKV